MKIKWLFILYPSYMCKILWGKKKKCTWKFQFRGKLLSVIKGQQLLEMLTSDEKLYGISRKLELILQITSWWWQAWRRRIQINWCQALWKYILQKLTSDITVTHHLNRMLYLLHKFALQLVFRWRGKFFHEINIPQNISSSYFIKTHLFSPTILKSL